MRVWDGYLGVLALVLGSALQLQQPVLWTTRTYLGLLLASVGLLLATLWTMRRRAWSGWQRAAAGLGVLCLAFAQTGWRAALQREQWLPADWEGRTLWAEGEVVSLPQWHAQGVRFRFRIDQLRTPDGTALSTPPQRVWLGWYGPPGWGSDDPAAGDDPDDTPSTRQPPSQLRVGDRWRWVVRLKAPHGHVNPHGFDHELWLWEQGITATGTVRAQPSEPAPERLAAAAGMGRWRQSVRDAVTRTVDDPSRAGRISALLLGDQASIERSDWDVFRATGVAHLMAISGLHITGLAWLAGVLAGALWRRSRWRWRARVPALWWPTPHVERVAGLLAAGCYAVFSGWGIPAQRTLWMLLLAHGLAMAGRRWPWPLSAGVVAAGIITLDPWAMTQAGFWLSFVAVALLFLSGPPGATDPTAVAPTVSARLWLRVRSMLREQAVMTVCLAPLSLLLFQQVSVVGLLANVLAVPWVTLCVTPLCLLGLLWSDAWSLAALALDGLMPLLQWLANWPVAQLSRPAVPAWAAVFAVLGGAVLAWPGPLAWRWLGCCWMLPMLSWQVPQPTPGRFALLAADLGQGHAVLVRTRRHALLYDTGPRYSAETDAGQRVLVPLLRALDVRLDRIVLSHQDSDHSGGLASVWSMQRQAEVWTSVPAIHGLWSGLPGVRPQRCVQGQRWEWDGVRFEVLHPTASDYAAHPPRKPNAMSCVLRIEDAHGVRALLTGDIEAAQERTLLAEDVQADWLLVPHHGSNTSSTLAFVQAVQPRWAMVQAGYRNRFGHPRPEVLARYRQAQIAVVASDRCGAATWRSEAPEALRCERQAVPRYWRHVPSEPR